MSYNLLPLRPLEYIYYRTYSFIRKHNLPFLEGSSVKATAVTIVAPFFALLIVYMLLLINGVINNHGILMLALFIGIALSIFPLNKYFEKRHQLFEERWSQQNRFIKIFLGYFIALITISLFIAYCFLSDFYHDLKYQ
jgi:hypothetical protein